MGRSAALKKPALPLLFGKKAFSACLPVCQSFPVLSKMKTVRELSDVKTFRSLAVRVGLHNEGMHSMWALA
jgi:hypothetical protein